MNGAVKRSARIALGAIVAGAVLSTACGGGGDKKTPATASTTVATKPAAAATSGGAGQATALTLVARNTLFDKSELKAKPGDVTITVDNQDDGIPHNVHVYKGKDNTGEDLGKTELEAGPVKQTMKLSLTKGEYFFVCEVHPATMSGKLEVE